MVKNSINILKKISELNIEYSELKIKKIIILKNKNIQLFNVLSVYYSNYFNMIISNIKKGLMSLKWKNYNNFLSSIENNIKIITNNLLKQQNEIDNELLIWKRNNKKFKIWSILNNKILKNNLKKKKILEQKTLNQYHKIYFFNKKML